MTSVGPMGRYAAALERSVHPPRRDASTTSTSRSTITTEVVALETMVRELLVAEPDLGADVIFGAEALTAVERRFADHLLDSWEAGRSSLLMP